MAEHGAPHGTVVAAIRQTGGRGRQGRRWDSLAGNLHASFVLRPAPPAARAPELGFAAALGVAETLERYLPESVRPGLKWPNDVLVAGGKIAGILVERSAEPGGTSWVVLGIGVNLAAAPTDLPYPAQALAAFVAAPTPADVLSLLAADLERWLVRWEREGFAPIAAAWSARGPSLGERLCVQIGAEFVEGTNAGLGPGGELLLDTPEGRRTIIVGEVLNAGNVGAPQRALPKLPTEIGGPPGPEPTRYGDWQFKGRVTDF